MKVKKKSIAIIPARGGSKGIPRKNVINLCGKPLIAYSIECALKSGVFDRVIVSTDSDEIALISKKYGAEVINRPSELARDASPTLPVLKHALGILKMQKYSPEFVYLLQPTSPLRKQEEILKIEKLMQTGKYGSIITVTGNSQKVLLTLGKKNEIMFMDESGLAKRRQDLNRLYRITGSIYAFKYDLLLGMKKHVFEAKAHGFVAGEISSIDIDTFEDLRIAQALIKSGLG